ncbi:HET domain-containing protein [Fusarium keratoplasticum]|uniref:HET domain-containing protein n=1 Tax=Fusarium keratoplasticum TaxID=1328300 RepID=A0ACC0QPZ1_9HYPO|nr:HET domain-containing protein [Fusarium keratoplasticum]KAI8663240.1 HET domain-containing protein [Fusarium keratoplasticum]
MDSATLDTRCKKCQELSKAVNQEPFDRAFSHYKTFKELEASAAAGCPLCQLLRRVLLFSARDIEELHLGTQVEVTPLGSKSPRPENLWVVIGDSEDGSFGGVIYPPKYNSIEPIRQFKPQDRETDLEHLVRERIQPWVKTCCRDHALCNLPHGQTSPSTHIEKPPLPNRVIDVGVKGASPRLYVPKLEQGSTVFSDYLILSYRWGKGNLNARTTRHNFEQRRAKINLEELSQTILDAIDVTRAMGQRYLFVDAICIIQHNQGEDATDWLAEAPLMGRYYQNALCTIAAAGAYDSDDGFLTERPGELYHVSPVLLARYNDSDQPGQEIYADPSNPLWQANVMNTPLYDRGWTLQERSLSNRIIHFGRDAVFWECVELQASEGFPKGVPQNKPVPSDNRSHQQLLRSKDTLRAQALGEYWFQLVREYSSMDFTYFDDRLVAIQGVADRTRLFFPDTYVCGHFVSQFIFSLAWHGTGSICTELERSKMGPSWSWASSKMSRVGFAHLDNPRFKGEAKLLSVQDSLRSPPGSLQPKREVVLSTLVRSLQVLLMQDDGEGLNIASGVAVDVQGREISTRIFFDDPASMPEDLEPTFEIAQVVYEIPRPSYISRGCLILSPATGEVGKEDVFERIGWLELMEPLGRPTWKRKNITIV